MKYVNSLTNYLPTTVIAKLIIKVIVKNTRNVNINLYHTNLMALLSVYCVLI